MALPANLCTSFPATSWSAAAGSGPNFVPACTGTSGAAYVLVCQPGVGMGWEALSTVDTCTTTLQTNNLDYCTNGVVIVAAAGSNTKIGHGAAATGASAGHSSVAIGEDAASSNGGGGAIALGAGATATDGGGGALAIGDGSSAITAGTGHAIAIGVGAVAGCNNVGAIAIGGVTVTDGEIKIGFGAAANLAITPTIMTFYGDIQASGGSGKFLADDGSQGQSTGATNITLLKLTPGGIDGALTFKGGILTAFTRPT